MPSCFVPGCRSGYDKKTSIGRHYFIPPKNEIEFSKWKKAIPRKDKDLTLKSYICDKHFSDQLLIKSDSFVIKGEKVEIPRIRWTLRPGSVPHIFQNLPKYLSTDLKVRKSPKKRCNLNNVKRIGTKRNISKFQVQEESKNEPSNSVSTFHNANAVDPKKETVRNLKRKIKILSRNLTRAQANILKQNAKMRILEKQLAESRLKLTENKFNLLSKKQKLIVDTMLKKRTTNARGMRYTDKFLLDSLLLKIKSPRGYRHCVKHDLLPLPSETHLRKLTKGLKCSYGVNKHALTAISNYFQNEKDDNKRLGIVIFDEVKLREEIRFNSSSLKLDGFVDLGDLTPEDKKNACANHALVFMFIPLLHNWIQPVAIYASRNATPGDILAKILIEVIIQLEQSGARVIGFTSDGSQSNKKAWVNLGICGKKGNINCSFKNPIDQERRVWAFSDFVHILKCIRNFFHDKGKVLYRNKDIDFNFYRRVYETDTSPAFAGLRSCPKLTSAHLNPTSFQRMNARLAFQLFSNSVADSIKFFRQMKPEYFINSEHTETFTKDINDLADSLNSMVPIKSLHKDSQSHKTLLKFLETIKTQNNTFASERTMESLTVTLTSTLEIAQYLWDKGFTYVLTAKFNQDPLERHFGILRSITCDDHPSTVDFLHLHMLQSIYVPVKLALSSASNCESKVESPLTSFVNQIRLFAKQTEEKNRDLSETVEKDIKEKIVLVDWENEVPLQYENNISKKCLVHHLAGYIVKKLCKKTDCLACVPTLLSQQSSDSVSSTFTTIKDYGTQKDRHYLSYPSKTVLSILLQVEAVLELKLRSEENLWGDIFYECLDSIEGIVVGPQNLGCSTEHKLNLCGKLIFHYLKCRFYFRTKEINKEQSAGKNAKASRKLSKLSNH